MKILQRLFCGIILAALTIPGWLTMMKPLTGRQVIISPAEQRRLVRFEQAAEAWPDIKSTVQTFGRAFDDQLFARTAVLQAVNGVLVEKGGHATADSIVFGEDGYRFLLRRQNTKAFIQIPCAVPGGLDEDKRQLTIDNYIAFARRMQAKGVETRLVIIPTKSSVFPEKLPNYVRSMCVGKTPAAVDTVKQLKAAGLSARYDLDWFRSAVATDIYHPQAFHWVKAKSHIYAQYLYNASQQEWGKTMLPTHKTKSLQTQIHVDISRHLGIKANTTRFDGTAYVWPSLQIYSKATFKQIEDRYEMLRKLDKSVDLYGNNSTQQGGKLLMIGDSFSKELFPYWAIKASESIFINDTWVAYKPGVFDEAVKNFGANKVVFVIEESKFAPIKSKYQPYPFATKLLPPE